MSELEDQLNDFMNDPYDQLVDTDEKRESFQGLTDQHMAGWALRREHWHTQQQLEANRVADAAIERINQFRDEVVARESRNAKWFENELKAYAIKQRNASPLNKKGEHILKTVPVEGGSISTFWKKPAPKIADPELLVEWAKANDHEDLINTKTTETPIHAKLKEFVDKDGNVVAGLNQQMIDPATGEPIEGAEVTEGELTIILNHETAGDE